MSHGPTHESDILSLDLDTSLSPSVDVTGDFPFTDISVSTHEEQNIETLQAKESTPIDLSIKQNVRVDRFTDLHTLDIAHRDLSRERGLTRGDVEGHDRYTVSICPPLSPAYGALDIRSGPVPTEKRYYDLYRRTLPTSLHLKRMLRNTSETLRTYRKPVGILLALIIGLSVPSLFYVRSLVEGAYGELQHISLSETPTEISKTIHTARAQFERANVLFTPYRYIPSEKIHLARIAIDGGLSLTRGVDQVLGELQIGSSGSIVSESRDMSDSLFRPTAKDMKPLAFLGVTEPTSWFRDHRTSLIYLRDQFARAGTAYSEAEGLDHPRAAEIAHVGRGLSRATEILDFALENEKNILALLGAENPERYIILNQNRDEIRANGGFPGSVITFTMHKGNISDYRTDDVYYYDWNLYPQKEAPPPGLALITGNYGLRDVSYYGDFRETLEKANNFIERSGDPTVTVGLAIHQGLIEDILTDIGPVTLSGVTEPFRGDNFSLLMSLLVESRYGEKTSAKDILGEFVGAFVAKIEEKKAYEEVLTHVMDALKDGEILFASRNEGIDTFLDTYKKPLPWEKRGNTSEGVISNTLGTGKTLFEKAEELIAEKNSASIRSQEPLPSNWAYPLLTSLSGNKSDRLIERIYKSDTMALNSCQVLNTLTFTHKHTYRNYDEKQILSYMNMMGLRDSTLREKLLAIQGKGRNKTYMRVMVPIATALTGSTAGLDVSATPDYREIAFTIDTPLSGSTTKKIQYIAQIPDCTKPTPLTWYRQPGLQHTTFESK